MFPLPVDVVSQPSVVDWLTAVGTLLAVLVALGVAVREARLGRQDRAERSRLMRQEQAALVCAWLCFIVRDSPGAPMGLRETFATLVVSNASAAPVFDFAAVVPEGLRFGPFFDAPAVVAPNKEPRHVWTDLLGDDVSWSALGFEEPPSGPLGDGECYMAVEITFRDASGVWWLRGADGQLTEHPPAVQQRNAATWFQGPSV